ncbi:MAG: hypothetical protein H7842_12210 [Gammaproteobacteria bacterium SHHR-1]|uniref:hypothetical protein n=1 Tax=Magnetovirga frankeli TaxID=947516 RepID=UPI00129303F5|nr:hypothetical protein D5125_11650 [gamma proteobacterium SS-5]
MKLPNTLAALEHPDLPRILQAELQSAAHQPPLQDLLQAALRHGSQALDESLQVLLQGLTLEPERAELRLNLLFQGVIAGCNCADDPSPQQATTAEQCPLRLRIDRRTGQAQLSPLEE